MFSKSKKAGVTSLEIPDRLKVGNVRYSVLVGDDEVRLAEHGLAGETNHQQRIIRLSDRMSWEAQRDTLFHEVLHCVTRHTTQDREWGDKAENWVERLETSLLMVFCDNPDLVRMLLPEEGK